MTKQLYEVPVTFTLRLTALVMADSTKEARHITNNQFDYDDSNLYESNIFFDQNEVTLKEPTTCQREIGMAVESDDPPEDHGFGVEGDGSEGDGEPGDEPEKTR